MSLKADFHFCRKPPVAGSAKTSESVTESIVFTLQITSSAFCVRWIEWLAVLESVIATIEHYRGCLGLVFRNGNADGSHIEHRKPWQKVTVSAM